MADYLVMRLYGPLASWGEIAVGESRHSAVHPSKSALIGLLGAALGIKRDDDTGQATLIAGYRFGVKLVSVGTPLRDYHTIQAPEQQRKIRYRTRRQELADPTRVGTLLSAREYRCDSIALVAVEALSGAPASLSALDHALRHPVFPLYLGRKSCPLAVPLSPQQVGGVTLRSALDDTPQYSLFSLLNTTGEHAWPTREDRIGFRLSAARYYWESGMDAGMEASFHTDRHDQPLSRLRWQFAPRQESVFLAAEESR
ncbi:type I-E CRISPR-associated protein Cas5/CasD [Pigmentiphaga aceris]|uniref:Type I-E CRISPR-associated protein Cas5/CasD n=1 Tax=Pigmentiphaga aceris TaxID=1940612 RepID=A0A5C0B1C3_9BURK|nr:type I-E CRISPR-associated protein Cas5/CasD [Pigmentiphaga aceris]QEI07674.1 type I-E CRISPR-associated protein Cas5/CasD [Pigmentiphaga aceris]